MNIIFTKNRGSKAVLRAAVPEPCAVLNFVLSSSLLVLFPEKKFECFWVAGSLKEVKMKTHNTVVSLGGTHAQTHKPHSLSLIATVSLVPQQFLQAKELSYCSLHTDIPQQMSTNAQK